MNPLLADWYNDVSIGLPGEILTARAAAIDELLPQLDRASVLALVGLAHEHPQVEQDDWFREPFKKHDATFLMRGNDRELAVLAGACLVDVCAGEDDLAVLVASATAVACRRGWTSSVGDLPGRAEQRLVDLGTARRQLERRPVAAKPTVWTKGVPPAVANGLSEAGVTPASVTAALDKLAGATNRALETAAVQVDRVADWSERALSLCTEEGDLLSWLLAGHSNLLDVPWASLDAGTAAIVAGRELADLLVVLPAPPQADALIDQILFATPFSEEAAKVNIPPLDVPAPLNFLLEQQEVADADLADLARLGLRQAVLLKVWSQVR